MTRFVHWLDPKLERFRGPKKKPEPYTPKNEKELVGVLQRTPETVLSAVQRVAIASAMSYQNIPVSKIMEKLNTSFRYTKTIFWARSRSTASSRPA